eukprot:COSAG06_NODE_28220_length_578_cov_1.085595_2_plen_33_part_01
MLASPGAARPLAAVTLLLMLLLVTTLFRRLRLR